MAEISVWLINCKSSSSYCTCAHSCVVSLYDVSQWSSWEIFRLLPTEVVLSAYPLLFFSSNYDSCATFLQHCKIFTFLCSCSSADLFVCVKDENSVEKPKLFEIRVTAPQSSIVMQNEKWKNATKKGRRRMDKEVSNRIFYTSYWTCKRSFPALQIAISMLVGDFAHATLHARHKRLCPTFTSLSLLYSVSHLIHPFSHFPVPYIRMSVLSSSHLIPSNLPIF